MLELLNHPLLANPYIKSGIILFSFYIISQVIYIGLIRFVLVLTKKTKTEVDDKIIGGTNKAVGILLLLIGVYLAFEPFRQCVKCIKYIDVLENITASAIIILLTYIVIVIIDILIDSWLKKFTEKTESKFDDQIVPLLHRFSRVAFFLIGLMFVLPVWGIQIGPLLASLGIAGLAIAFALQATLSNIFGGASLLIDKAVRVGDFIELENGMVGEVMEVGLRSTRLKNTNNEIIVMPSGKLADMRIVNYSLPDSKIRVIIPLGVEYGSDVDKVKQVILESIKPIKKIFSEPAPEVCFISMGDFALNFQLRFWIRNFSEKFEVKSEANERIYKALVAAGIGIPFPTRTIHMRNEEKR